MADGDLTHAQWAQLEPLLPRGRKPGRPPIRIFTELQANAKNLIIWDVNE
ncbi:hypothetical protein [Streptomyces cyaneus]|nr:hypothetical protein [Streptomyces cyaneus]